MLNSKYSVLTVKDYLPRPEQLKVESEIIDYIQEMWDKHKLSCIFIPTGANPIEENDLPVGERIDQEIGDKKIFVVKVPKTPEETRKIIKNAKYAICTRMHSAIFAITEFTPFIAIAYEHKSIGLLESLSLSKWYIKMTDVTCVKLRSMTIKLLQPSTYKKFTKTLHDQREIIVTQRAKLVDEIKAINHKINI